MEMWMRPTSMGCAGPCFLKQVRFSPVPLRGPEAACSTMGRTLNGPRPALGGGSVAGGVVGVAVVAVRGGAVVLVVVASAASSMCSPGRWLAAALSRGGLVAAFGRVLATAREAGAGPPWH